MCSHIDSSDNRSSDNGVLMEYDLYFQLILYQLLTILTRCTSLKDMKMLIVSSGLHSGVIW